jgi:hypothetical protein
MEITERSIAARRSGRGQVRVPSKFGAASKGRQLSTGEREIVETEMRMKDRL